MVRSFPLERAESLLVAERSSPVGAAAAIWLRRTAVENVKVRTASRGNTTRESAPDIFPSDPKIPLGDRSSFHPRRGSLRTVDSAVLLTFFSFSLLFVFLCFGPRTLHFHALRRSRRSNTLPIESHVSVGTSTPDFSPKNSSSVPKTSPESSQLVATSFF